MGLRHSTVGKVKIKTFPHYGEYAIPHIGIRTAEDGSTEREFILLDCKHGLHKVWLKRTDI